MVVLNIALSNKQCIKTAFENLNWEEKHDYDVRYFSGQTKKFATAYKNPNGGYDVGLAVTQNEHGEIYSPEADLYGGSIEETLGSELCNFQEAYALAVLHEESFKKYGCNYTLETRELENKELLIEISI